MRLRKHVNWMDLELFFNDLSRLIAHHLHPSPCGAFARSMRAELAPTVNGTTVNTYLRVRGLVVETDCSVKAGRRRS